MEPPIRQIFPKPLLSARYSFGYWEFIKEQSIQKKPKNKKPGLMELAVQGLPIESPMESASGFPRHKLNTAEVTPTLLHQVDKSEGPGQVGPGVSSDSQE